MDPVTQIETRLLGVMASWQMPIESGCEHHLRQAIRDGAERAVREGQTAFSPRILEAEQNLRKLLTEMTREAGALGFAELHELTFFAAKAKICPLWPFC